MRDKLIGHKLVIDFFGNVLKSGKISHAYCFVGPRKIGKKRVAEEVAVKILGIQREKIYAGSDIALVERQRDEKTGKTKKNIDIDQIRDLKSSLQLKSASGNYKVAIIDNAELMSPSAANALLKVLEEPRKKTIFFLLVTDEDSLPQTIKSRCQLVFCHKVAVEEMIQELSDIVVDAGKLEQMASAADGRPGQLLEWIADEDVFQSHEIERHRFGGLFNKAFHEKVELVEELYGSKEDHIAEREKLDAVLSLWQTLARKYFFEKIHLTKEEFVALEDAIFFGREMLTKNIHPRLLVEKILLLIP